MNSFRHVTAITVSVLMALAVFAQDESAPIQILRTGLWHGDQVTAEGGPDWWGIFPEGDGYSLQRAPVTMTLEEDAMMSDSPDNPTGKRVRVPQEAMPVLLIQGLKDPVQGPLITPATLSLPRPVYPGKGLDLRLHGVAQPEFVGVYALGKVVTFSSASDFGFENYEIVLYSGERGAVTEQTLAVIPGVTDGKPQLEWAGDLDRDGKIDVLYNITDHYVVTHLVLFLSSAAKTGELVGKAGEWRTAGC